MGRLQRVLQPNATFSAQAEPLPSVEPLAQYADWMKGMMKILPDSRYGVRSVAADGTLNKVTVYGIFRRPIPARIVPFL